MRRFKNIFRCAGAFVAWVIGSGFATGQEVLQFFTSYGYASYGIILIGLVGFLFMGVSLYRTGQLHKDEKDFKHFEYFCGKRLGGVYSWLIPMELVPVMAVLVSGAGATLQEYYGLNHYLGAMFMAAAVLMTYFLGFERLVKLLSFVGPSIIAFCLLIGSVTLFRDMDNFARIGEYEAVLAELQPSSHWAIGALLYVSYNCLDGSAYYTQVGKTAGSLKEAVLGAVLGAVMLMAAIAVMNTAILLHGDTAAALAVPSLYLARRISPVLGAVFSVFLVMGIFSCCSAMLWTVCSKFSVGDARKDRLIAVGVVIGVFLLGLLPFGELIGAFYPIIGYMGWIFIGCVLVKGLRRSSPL